MKRLFLSSPAIKPGYFILEEERRGQNQNVKIYDYKKNT